MTPEKQARLAAVKAQLDQQQSATPIPEWIVQPNPPVAVMLNMGLDPTKHISEQKK